MSFPKVSFEESLEKNVVRTGKCVSCGTCVVVCPFGCLELKQGTPTIVKECKICGICAQVCPQNELVQSKAEAFVFGRERRADETFGIHRRLCIARANDPKVRSVSQDGGAVTALLLFALEKGIIDGAIVSGLGGDRPFYPVPKLASTPEEIMAAAGTRYSYSPNILALSEAIKSRKTSIAFVGTPCQIRALRRIQMAGLKKYAAPLKVLIGLMCSESFTYEGLMEDYIHNKLGINLQDIVKINIKGKMLVTTKSEVKAIPLAEVKQYVRRGCGFCQDFSSELADISAGGLGLEGWTFIIIRTNEGEELFSGAEKVGALEIKPLEGSEPALNLLVKLSAKKHKQPSS